MATKNTVKLDTRVIRNLGTQESNLRQLDRNVVQTANSTPRRDYSAALRGADEALLGIRLYVQSPILGRVYDLLDKRHKGEAPEALSSDELSALMKVIGPIFSNAENDLLNHLHAVGLVNEKDWTTTVLPARKMSNEQQDISTGQFKFLSMANQGASLPLMAGAVAVGGLPVMFGAMGLAMAHSLTSAPRIQARINSMALEKNELVGMPAAEGMESTSNAALLLKRAARGDILRDDGRPVSERLNDEVQLASLLAGAQSAAINDGTFQLTPVEQELNAISSQYVVGLARLFEENEAQPLSESDLAKRIYDLRAEALSPEKLSTGLKLLLAREVLPDDSANKAEILAEYARTIVPSMIAQLEQNAGATDPNTQQQAVAVSALAIKGEPLHGYVPKDTAKLLETLSQGGTLDSSRLADLKRLLGEGQRKAEGDVSKFSLNERRAKTQGGDALEAFWNRVLPSLDTVLPIPGEKLQAVRVKDGYAVTGSMRKGLWGETGSFSLKINSDGTLNVADSTIDVGAPMAASIAQEALDDLLAFGVVSFNGRPEPMSTRPNADGYDVKLGTAQGSSFTLHVSKLGLVDWKNVQKA
jgi:hypothetical protein